MEYNITVWSIEKLVKNIKTNLIDLRPSYQRNDIWTKKDQRSLIDTIKAGYPIPNLFIRDLGNDKYEMVDGQQRALTIMKYINNEFADSEKIKFADSDSNTFLNYKLSVTIIIEPNTKQIENFFYLVNKKGVTLNSAEINKAHYNGTDFMNIITKITQHQYLINLDLFTERGVARMNDLSLIDELLAYLFSGITEKRDEVEKLYNTKISEKVQKEKYERFINVLERINTLNSIKPINETRYKQKNDFYTLFCFIDRHLGDEINVLKKQYEVLLFLSDEELISPSEDECAPLYQYAINCVSQSNSKKAREGRLSFFEELLCSKGDSAVVSELRSHIRNIYGEPVSLEEVGEYKIIDLSEF